jgi:hypothetical protein
MPHAAAAAAAPARAPTDAFAHVLASGGGGGLLASLLQRGGSALSHTHATRHTLALASLHSLPDAQVRELRRSAGAEARLA